MQTDDRPGSVPRRLHEGSPGCALPAPSAEVPAHEPIDASSPPASDRELFPIVAIGASAGGLEALRQLFAHLPSDTGMAYVVIQHLDPLRPSSLTSVLAVDLGMPVVEVVDGMRAEPNRVHVIPPHADLSIHAGVLTLVPRRHARKVHLPIDTFLRALAEDLPGRAIGVVLSGSASDGTEGLRAITAAGGITLVQEPGSAQFPSMPESAIGAGVVDVRATPEGIARELLRLSRQRYLAPAARGEEARPDDVAMLPCVMAALRRHALLYFRGY
jgi:two-component system CheB/CheR fusion protein